MKLTEYRTRALNYPEILKDRDTELFVMTMDDDGNLELHDVVAVLFGGGQIIFTFQEGIAPPKLEAHGKT